MPIDFDGSDDSLTLASNFSTLTGSLTICAWVKPDSVTGSRYIAEDWSGSGKNWLLFLNGAAVNAIIGNGSTAQDTTLAGGTLSIGSWHHVCLRRNGTAQEIFLDGSSVDSQTGSYTGGSTSNTRKIGDAVSGSGSFDGIFEEVRFYDAALSDAEIAILAGARHRRIGGELANNLFAHFELTEGTPETSADGDTIVDSSGNGNTATGNDGAGNSGLTWKASTHLSRSAA